MGSNYRGLWMAGAALCFVGGFFFPLLFIPAIILAAESLTATPQELHEAQRPEPVARSLRTSLQDPDWKTRALECCESPAEATFLTAMIRGFDLQPQLGVLCGSGLSLELQVELGHYRLDFLANGWLIIEVDGATYHSSAEAIARDKARDAYCESYGYTVLRIPASVVFSKRAEAVASVRSALAAGRRVEAPADERPAPARKGFGAMVGSFAKAIEDVNRYAAQASASQEALALPERIFAAEKSAIELALQHAEREVQAEAYRSKSAEHRKFHDEAHGRLTALLKGDPGQPDPEEGLRRHFREHIVPIEAPMRTGDPEIDAGITRVYDRFMAGRAEYFSSIRRQLQGRERRRMLVKARLEEVGCRGLWDAIA